MGASVSRRAYAYRRDQDSNYGLRPLLALYVLPFGASQQLPNDPLDPVSLGLEHASGLIEPVPDINFQGVPLFTPTGGAQGVNATPAKPKPVCASGEISYKRGKVPWRDTLVLAGRKWE